MPTSVTGVTPSRYWVGESKSMISAQLAARDSGSRPDPIDVGSASPFPVGRGGRSWPSALTARTTKIPKPMAIWAIRAIAVPLGGRVCGGVKPRERGVVGTRPNPWSWILHLYRLGLVSDLSGWLRYPAPPHHASWIHLRKGLANCRIARLGRCSGDAGNSRGNTPSCRGPRGSRPVRPRGPSDVGGSLDPR